MKYLLTHSLTQTQRREKERGRTKETARAIKNTVYTTEKSSNRMKRIERKVEMQFGTRRSDEEK